LFNAGLFLMSLNLTGLFGLFEEPDTGNVDQVLIHLNNIPQGKQTIPGSGGVVKIESRRYSNEVGTLDAMATFYNVPVGSAYTITGWHKTTNKAFNNPVELWGIRRNVEISDQNSEITFVRNMPYIAEVSKKAQWANQANPSMQIGENLVFEITLRNPSLQSYRAQLVLLLKNTLTGKTTEIKKDIHLPGGQITVHTRIPYSPLEAGEYHFAAGLYVRQRLNQWTDCWDWSEDPLFFVTGRHRQIMFSGYSFDVKAGYGNPGPNFWTNDTTDVWIDNNGRLNLTLSPRDNGRWYATEVISEKTFGYGTYTFFVDADPQYFDSHVVAGIFLYRDDENEIDIEFSRWGDAENYHIGNYVIQPADNPGNQFRFPIITNGTFTTHRIDWSPDEILFSSWHGHYDDPPEGRMIAQWQYTGNNIPLDNQIRLYFNIWLFKGIIPKIETPQIFTIAGFTFQPYTNTSTQ
jgi:hypothetical protein